MSAVILTTRCGPLNLKRWTHHPGWKVMVHTARQTTAAPRRVSPEQSAGPLTAQQGDLGLVRVRRRRWLRALPCGASEQLFPRAIPATSAAFVLQHLEAPGPETNRMPGENHTRQHPQPPLPHRPDAPHFGCR